MRQSASAAADGRAAIVDATVAMIRRRLEGAPARATARLDKARVVVEVQTRDAETLQRLRRRIENPGRLEMRIVAHDRYGHYKFDLTSEKQRLAAWLGDPANRALVDEDPVAAIDRFNRLPAEEGGPQAGQEHLRWAPMKRRLVKTDGKTGWVYEDHGDAFPRARGEPKTPKFLPVNCHEIGFTTGDLESEAIEATTDEMGKPAVSYSLTMERQKAFFEFSKRNVRKDMAIVLNGEVVLAPTLIGAIQGRGLICGGFSQDEVDDLIVVLRSGPLPANLLFVSAEKIEIESSSATRDRKEERKP
jgi:preprotein translocase subunit SecD